MKRRRWAWVGGGCAGLFAVMVTAAMLGYQYVAYLPPPPHLAPPTSGPNAQTDFLAAIALMPPDADSFFGRPRSTSAPAGSASPLDTPALRDLIRRSQPALRRFRQGLRRDFVTYPIGGNEVKPELSGYRKLAYLLLSEADLATREGQLDQALQNGLDTLRLGTTIPRGGELTDYLTGSAILGIGLQSLQLGLSSSDAALLERGARELIDLDRAAPTYAEVLRMERDAGQIHHQAWLRSEPPEQKMRTLWEDAWQSRKLPGQEELQEATLYLVTPRRTILAEVARNVEAEMARAERPYQERGTLPSPPVNPLIEELLLFSGDASLNVAARSSLRRRVAAVWLAVRAYTLRQGHPLATLSALVPNYLPTIPEDPFAPGPLLYRIVAGQPLVYSRGPDGDDDGGRDLGSRIDPGADGDLTCVPRTSGSAQKATK